MARRCKGGGKTEEGVSPGETPKRLAEKKNNSMQNSQKNRLGTEGRGEKGPGETYKSPV